MSGLLNVIALWLQDPEDADLSPAWEGIARWMWEDEGKGCRVAGARSASWDTSLAMQGIASATLHRGAAPGVHAPGAGIQVT